MQRLTPMAFTVFLAVLAMSHSEPTADGLSDTIVPEDAEQTMNEPIHPDSDDPVHSADLSSLVSADVYAESNSLEHVVKAVPQVASNCRQPTWHAQPMKSKWAYEGGWTRMEGGAQDGMGGYGSSVEGCWSKEKCGYAFHTGAAQPCTPGSMWAMDDARVCGKSYGSVCDCQYGYCPKNFVTNVVHKKNWGKYGDRRRYSYPKGDFYPSACPCIRERCEKNQHVSNGECVKCPAGTTKDKSDTIPGWRPDRVDRGDTSCETAYEKTLRIKQHVTRWFCCANLDFYKSRFYYRYFPSGGAQGAEGWGLDHVFTHEWKKEFTNGAQINKCYPFPEACADDRLAGPLVPTKRGFEDYSYQAASCDYDYNVNFEFPFPRCTSNSHREDYKMPPTYDQITYLKQRAGWPVGCPWWRWDCGVHDSDSCLHEHGWKPPWVCKSAAADGYCTGEFSYAPRKCCPVTCASSLDQDDDVCIQKYWDRKPEGTKGKTSTCAASAANCDDASRCTDQNCVAFPEKIQAASCKGGSRLIYPFTLGGKTSCSEALSGAKDAGYRGCQTKTQNGYTCQRWDSQSPHKHANSPEQRPDSGLEGNNYCRNPDGESTIWCYTTDPNKRWDYCKPLKRNAEYYGCSGKYSDVAQACCPKTCASKSTYTPVPWDLKPNSDYYPPTWGVELPRHTEYKYWSNPRAYTGYRSG